MTEPNTMQFRSEGDPAFPVEDTENEDSAGSSPEETADPATPSSEEDKDPSHENAGGEPGSRDPKSGLNNPTVERWQQRENDWKDRYNEQEKRHQEELDKIRKEIDEKFASTKTAPTGENIPAWFGGDEAQWEAYKRDRQAELDAAEARAVEKITSKQTAEQKAIQAATDYFNETHAALEKESGEKIDRNKLLKTAMDNDLVDSKGRWNYRAAYAIMKAAPATPARNTAARKVLAAATASEGGGEPANNPYMTSEDFQKPGAKPW